MPLAPLGIGDFPKLVGFGASGYPTNIKDLLAWAFSGKKYLPLLLPLVGTPVDIQAYQVLWLWQSRRGIGVICSWKSKIPRVMDLVQGLTFCTLRHNFYFQEVHVPGKQNIIADSLSRFQMERSGLLAPHFRACPILTLMFLLFLYW